MVEKVIVVKLGGHVFSPEPDPNKLRGYVDIFKQLRSEGYRVVVVTGGGRTARTFINTARELGATESFCDIIGIEATRLNAELLIAGLGEEASSNVPTSVDKLIEAADRGKVVVLGGLIPGQSTDAVAAMTAELLSASLLIKATDVDGVYSADPKKDAKAKKLDKVTYSELRRLSMRGELGAGGYQLFDPSAIRFIERSSISTVILDGRDPTNILKAVRGEKIGTLIIRDKS